MARTRAGDADRHVGREVRRRREQLGLSQARLAAELGVASYQLSKYETGGNRVPARRLPDLATALGCRIDDLFPPLAEDWSKTAAANLVDDVSRMPARRMRAVCKVVRSLAGKEA